MFGLKLFILFGVAFALIAFVNSSIIEVPAGSKEFNEAKKLLKNSLSKFRKGSDPDYRLGKIDGLTRQDLFGVIYKFKNVGLTDKKTKETLNCQIKLWSRSGDKGTELTVNCTGKKHIISKHS